MTQEQKDLLLKDMSSRLPYGVKGQYLNSDDPLLKAVTISYGSLDKSDGMVMDGSLVPWLFPFSSMTEGQKLELTTIKTYVSLNKNKEYLLFDWFNANHFDYRGLIPMELANDATGLNIYRL